MAFEATIRALIRAPLPLGREVHVQQDQLAQVRAAVEQALVDTRQALAHTRTPIACPTTPGCGGCCRGAVEVHPTEVARIAPLLDGATWDRVVALVGRLYRVRSDAEYEQVAITALCPLLEPTSRACTVYAERPLVCRGYAVATPVDDCYPERVGHRQVGTPAALYTAIGMAQLGLCGDAGPSALQPLPEALLSWREEQ